MRAEVEEQLGGRAELADGGRPGRMALRFDGEASDFERLRSVVAVHRVEHFDVPRPRGLLGQESWQRLRGALGSVLSHRRAEFSNFRLSAAGSDSPEFARLKQEIGRTFGLEEVKERAQLLVAVRRGRAGGWEVLLRTTPRPLSSRAWRACDLPGALDATIANAMVRLARPRGRERFLNVLTGSGTLLIERLLLGRSTHAVGVDTSAEALDCAATNVEAAGLSGQVRLVLGDGTRLPFPNSSFDTVVADLPFGQLMGSGPANRDLYPRALSEGARVLRTDGRAVFVTANRRTMQDALGATTSFRLDWETTIQVPHRGGYISPAIYALTRVV